jgi:hypothetical protein
LRQICCIKGIADLSAQPALQPTVMICVKRGDFTMGGCFDNGHGAMGIDLKQTSNDINSHFSFLNGVTISAYDQALIQPARRGRDAWRKDGKRPAQSLHTSHIGRAWRSHNRMAAKANPLGAPARITSQAPAWMTFR